MFCLHPNENRLKNGQALDAQIARLRAYRQMEATEMSKKLKTEHAGAKNGGGFRGPRAEAKALSKTKRRKADKLAVRDIGLSPVDLPDMLGEIKLTSEEIHQTMQKLADMPVFGHSGTMKSGPRAGQMAEDASIVRQRQRLHDPSELEPEDVAKALRDVQQILWPDGDIHHLWDSDTIDEVASVLTNAGLGPDYTGNS